MMRLCTCSVTYVGKELLGQLKALECWPRRLEEDAEEGIVGEVVVKKRSSVSQILRRKNFFDARRKSLFAKREKLKLEGDGEEEEDVDVRLFFFWEPTPFPSISWPRLRLSTFCEEKKSPVKVVHSSGRRGQANEMDPVKPEEAEYSDSPGWRRLGMPSFQKSAVFLNI